MASRPVWWSRDSEAVMVHFVTNQDTKAGRPPWGKRSAALAAGRIFSDGWMVLQTEDSSSLEREGRSLVYRNNALPPSFTSGLLKSPVKTSAIPSVSNAVSINHSTSIMASKCAWSKAPLGILLNILHSFVCSILSRARPNIIPGKTSEFSSPIPWSSEFHTVRSSSFRILSTMAQASLAMGVSDERNATSERVDFSCSINAARPEKYCWMNGSSNWGRPISSSHSGTAEGTSGSDMVCTRRAEGGMKQE